MSFSFTISSSLSRVTDTVMMLVYICKQAAVLLWPCLPLLHTHTMLRCDLFSLLQTRRLSLHEHLGCIMQIFPHSDVDMWGRVWMSCFRGAWQSLNFDKEYISWFWDFSLCNFRDLIYVRSACNTPKRKENLIASYDPFNIVTNICLYTQILGLT